MKKVKRKYTRKPEQDAPQSVIEPIKEESSSKIPIAFSFKDLPISLRMEIEAIIKWRKLYGLPDDSKERKEKAIKYFRGDRPR